MSRQGTAHSSPTDPAVANHRRSQKESLMKENVFAADQEVLDALLKRSTPLTFMQNTILFSQGQEARGLYILLSGEVMLMMRGRSGNLAQCLRATSGSLLGIPALCSNLPYTLTGVASKGSDVRFVTRFDFEHLVQDNAQLAIKVLRLAALETVAARQAISEM
jgi:CRP-like cAMP-binding protein